MLFILPSCDRNVYADARVASAISELQLQKEKSLAGQVPRFYFQKPAASSVALYLHKACHQLKETDVLTPEDLKAVKNAICGVCAQRDAVSVVNLEDAYLSASDVEQVSMRGSGYCVHPPNLTHMFSLL